MHATKIAMVSLLAAGAASLLAACGGGAPPSNTAGIITVPAVGSPAPTPVATDDPAPSATHHGSGGSGGSGSGTSSSTAPAGTALPRVDDIEVTCQHSLTGYYTVHIAYSAANADTVEISYDSWSTTTSTLSGTVQAGTNAGCFGINGQYTYTVVAMQTSTGLSATKTLDRVGTVPGPVPSGPVIILPTGILHQ